jgi:hypothetical protein
LHNHRSPFLQEANRIESTPKHYYINLVDTDQ